MPDVGFDYKDLEGEVQSLLLNAIPPHKSLEVRRTEGWISGAGFYASHMHQISKIMALPYVARQIVKSVLTALERRPYCSSTKLDQQVEFLRGYIAPLVKNGTPLIPILTCTNGTRQQSPWTQGNYLFDKETDLFDWELRGLYVKINDIEAHLTSRDWPTREKPSVGEAYNTIFVSGEMQRFSRNCCYMFSADIRSSEPRYRKGGKMRMYQMAARVRDLIAIGGGYTGIVGIWASVPQAGLINSEEIKKSKQYFLSPDSLYNMRYPANDQRSLNYIMTHPLIKSTKTGTHDQLFGNFPIWYPNPSKLTELLESEGFWKKIVDLVAADTDESIKTLTVKALTRITVTAGGAR